MANDLVEVTTWRRERERERENQDVDAGGKGGRKVSTNQGTVFEDCSDPFVDIDDEDGR